jgi:hypothetical protein
MSACSRRLQRYRGADSSYGVLLDRPVTPIYHRYGDMLVKCGKFPTLRSCQTE